MTRFPTTLKLAAIIITAASLLGVGIVYGKVQPIFVNDPSKITWITAALLATTLPQILLAAFRFERGDLSNVRMLDDAMSWSHFLRTKVFFSLGLIASLLGLIGFVTSIDVSSAANTLSAMKSSMPIAFNGTLVGISSKLFVDYLMYHQGRSLLAEPQSSANRNIAKAARGFVPVGSAA